MEEKQDKASFGMKLLSFLIPLVGLIIFISNKQNRPGYAKGCGIAALIGFIVGIVILPITVVGIILLATGAFIVSNVNDTIDTMSLIEQEVASYNSPYEIYEGTKTGTQVKTLLNSVKSHNDVQYNSDYIIKVKLNGIRVDLSSAISQIKAGYSYSVELNYDSSGLVNEIAINVINETTDTSTNTTANTITNTTTNEITNTITNTTTNTISNTNTITNTTANTITNTTTNTTANNVTNTTNTINTITNTLNNNI